MLKSLIRAASFVAIFVFATAVNFGQTTFPGSGVGLIPDGTSVESCQVAGVPLNVTFNVTGIATAPSNISVTMAFSPEHSFGGDVIATLIAPNGTQFVIFGYTGATTSEADDGGDGSNLLGPYTFNDAATSGWWAAAAAVVTSLPIPSGTYRTSQLGGPGATGAATNLNAAFTGIPTSNGTWTLRFTDGCIGDTGGVSSASLTLTPGGPVIPPQKPNVDMNGDNKSDFVITRQSGASTFTAPTGPGSRPLTVRERMKRDLERRGNVVAGLGTPIDWWGAYQDTFGVFVSQWGDSFTDWITPADFDGDDKDDVAVWRPGAPTEAGYFWIRSSDSTFAGVAFGQDGDNPSIVGDYDGDGTDDPAVFRCPSSGPGQCYFFYLGSDNNPGGGITSVPWGFVESLSDFLLPNPGDFDGDGKYDFCFQRENPDAPGQAQFVLMRSSDLGAEYIYWGLFLDVVVPGDYDGDGRSDFCVARVTDGQWLFYILERDGGGTGSAGIRWGLENDNIAPGDYDGDGKQDLAVYRWNPQPQNSVFWVVRSSDSQIQTLAWGLAGDVPAASWYVQQ
jgi:hypothetical protein